MDNERLTDEVTRLKGRLREEVNGRIVTANHLQSANDRIESLEKHITVEAITSANHFKGRIIRSEKAEQLQERVSFLESQMKKVWAVNVQDVDSKITNLNMYYLVGHFL